jgi:hypothetical protein
MSTQLASSPLLFHGAASPMVNVTTPLRRVTLSFLWSQDELTASASSSSNASSCRLLSWPEIKVLNSHHRHRPPSSDSPTLNLYCYKKVISTLITQSPITQPRLYFASSLARAPRHQSSTRHYRPPSNTHCPSIQWHSQCRTSWPSFASWTAYRQIHVKIYFKNLQYRAGLSTSLTLYVWHTVDCMSRGIYQSLTSVTPWYLK